MRLVKDQIESLRYVNHLWPVVILRLYVSFTFFSRYYEKFNEGFHSRPMLSAAIDEFLYSSEPPAWIQGLFVDYIQENWAVTASSMMSLEWFLGLLFLVGFLNRPSALVAMAYLYIMSFVASPVEYAQTAPFMIMLVTLMVFGSGRVGGLDYFFYKRQRGLIW